MILIGIGANLPAPGYRTPLETCRAALARVAAESRVRRQSAWYTSAPVPASRQPWFVNAVAEIETAVSPHALLRMLHDLEAHFGRVRRRRNAARTLDLDLLDYDGLVQEPAAGPNLPHPRMHERAFVIIPLCEIHADWRHPVSGRTADALRRALGADQKVERIAAP